MKFSTTFKMKRLEDCIKLQPLNLKDLALFDKLIETKKDSFVGEFSTPINKKSYVQVKTVHKLVEVIWKSLNRELHRKPTKEEHDCLYEDLKAEYADKRPSLLNKNKLVPIGLRESDTVSASRFIQNLINLLADSCDLDIEQQTEVIQVLKEWEEWRGGLVYDKMDDCTELEWYEMHKVSEASGQYGIEKAHIVSRGADVKDTDKAWNWLALTHSEHMTQHNYGWDFFLKKFPHLRPKVERARRLAQGASE